MALLDAYVDGRVLRLLSSEEFTSELHAATAAASGPDLPTEIAALEQRRRKVRGDLESLADNPDVDPTLAALAIASFDRKIAELRARMAVPAKLQRLGRLMGISHEEWLAQPIDVRATVVSDLFRVVILPTTWRGPGFDTSSVRLERRSL